MIDVAFGILGPGHWRGDGRDVDSSCWPKEGRPNGQLVGATGSDRLEGAVCV